MSHRTPIGALGAMEMKMIAMRTEVTVTSGAYTGTKGVITGKADRANLYVVTTKELVFWGKPYAKPHSADINLYPQEFGMGT